MNEAAQTHWIWFEWTGQRVGTPRLRQPGGQYLGECPPDTIGPVIKHYNYDGVGRLYRTTSPLTAPEGLFFQILNPNPPAPPASPYLYVTSLNRSERFFYDGTRRVQELITDPLLTTDEGDAITMANELYAGQPGSNVLNAGAPYVRAMYIWGPGDSPTSGVDELLVQIDPRDTGTGVVSAFGGKPWWAISDAQGDVIALLHKASASSTAEVAAQWTYSPYGEVLTYEQFHPHPVLVFGHKSLVVDRLDTQAVSWDTALGTISDTQRLIPGAKLISYARNRTYSPHLGRWLQQDPNASGQAVVEEVRFHGHAPGMWTVSAELGGCLGNGLGLFAYLGSNPLARFDPTGLSYDPFDMVDDFVAEDAASKAAFMEQLRGGFNSAAHIGWQVAQLHPAVGIAMAGYNLATGQFGATDLLSFVPGGNLGGKFAGRIFSSYYKAKKTVKAAREAGEIIERHHIVPMFMTGWAKGKVITLTPKHHDEYHELLRKALKKRTLPNENAGLDVWGPWLEKNTQRHGEGREALIESVRDFRIKTGMTWRRISLQRWRGRVLHLDCNMLFMIRSRKHGSLPVLPEWRVKARARYACHGCGAIRPEIYPTPIECRIDRSPRSSMASGAYVRVIAKSLFTLLLRECPSMVPGPVFLTSGKCLDEYVTVHVPRSEWVDLRGGAGSRERRMYRVCEVCGRHVASLGVHTNPIYVLRRTLTDRRVHFTEDWILVDETIASALTYPILINCELDPVEVRDTPIEAIPEFGDSE